MHSTKLVTSLLLAALSLSAAAHRPTATRHQSKASKHQPATRHKSQAKRTKKPARPAHQREEHSRVKRSKHPDAKHNAQRPVAHRQAAHPAKHHPARRVASVPSRPTKRRAERQPADRTYKVTATVYQAVPGQTDSSPFITADNSRIRPRYGSRTRWLALSPDLLKRNGGKFNYGDKVQVSHVSPQLDGVYTVHDTMNRRHRRRIDILTHRREKISVCAREARLRLADAPRPARKSRARATVAAHARPGRGTHARTVGFGGRAGGKRANYLASAIL